MKHYTHFRAVISGVIIGLFAVLPLLAQTPSTPGQPLAVDTDSRVKRDFKIPSGKTLQWESGSTFRLDDGTSFNIGSTAASALRTAIGGLNATKVFTNAANRTSTSASFLGQMGYQLDTQTFYYGYGLAAGEWDSRLNGDWLSASYLSVAGTGGAEGANFTGQAGVATFTRDGATADPSVYVNNVNGTGPALRLEGAVGDMLQIRDGTGAPVTTATIDKSGVLLAGAGAEAAPGLSFYGDPDTGFYRAAANSIGISANGAQIGLLSTSGLSLNTPLPILSGGTGASTAADARTALGVLRTDALQYSYTVPDGTHGGASTNGSWQTRPINTEDFDTGGLGALNTNVITLPGGNFRIRVKAVWGNIGVVKMRLYNNTASAVLVDGTSAAVSTSGGETTMEGRFTLSVQSDVSVQYWCTTSSGTNGLGVASSFAAGNEVFLTVGLQME